MNRPHNPLKLSEFWGEVRDITLDKRTKGRVR